MKVIILSVLLSLFVVGCSSKGALNSEQKRELISEYTQQKTFEISCDAGCTVAYKDPRDQLKLPSETNGWDVMNTAIGATASIVTSAVPYAAIGLVAKEGFKSSGDTVQGSYNTQTKSSTTVDRSTQLNDAFNTQTNTDSTHAPTVVTQPAPVIVDNSGGSDE